MVTRLQLGFVQMKVEGGEPERNLARAVRLLREARERGAEMAILPEAMNIGWTDGRTRELAERIPEGETFRGLAGMASELGMYLAAGIVEREGGKVFNSAVLLSPRGEMLLRHRKLNELEIAHDYYDLGDRLGVAETEFGRVGLMICADGFADGQCLGRALGYMGAGLILSPSAWAVEAGHDNTREPYGELWVRNYGPVAKDFGLWIAGCSNVGEIGSGPWAGRRCVGASLLVNPEGGVAWQGDYGVELVEVVEVVIPGRGAQGTGWSRALGRLQE